MKLLSSGSLCKSKLLLRKTNNVTQAVLGKSLKTAFVLLHTESKTKKKKRKSENDKEKSELSRVQQNKDNQKSRQILLANS